MTDEDKYLEQRFGHETGFRVPEGYFDQLVDRVMEHVPEDPAVERRGRRVWLRPLLAVAACVAALIIVLGVVVPDYHHDSRQNMVANQTTVSGSHEDALDATADYVMLDRDDIYSYISE